jgi:uncharacterized Zn-binding protein involved in type VI secretion
MGKPAARMGDMTMHGGSIVMGLPTVLIGGMPAARLGDMHVCPMVTPAGPAPIPHVGMPIMLGSAGVLIGGMPAARMGDMAACVGPPDSIALGCMTVLIGEAGGGGGGGGGAGAAGAGSGAAEKGAITSASIAGTQAQAAQNETAFFDTSVQDKAGKPISGVGFSLKAPDGTTQGGTLAGRIYRTGVPKGNHELSIRGIADVRWSAQNAKVGDKVKMIIETAGIDSGTKASLQVFVKDAGYTDHLLDTFETTVSGDKVEKEWTLEVDEKYLGICDKKEKTKKRYSQPFFYFRVAIGDMQERSGILYFKDELEVEIRDGDGNAYKEKEIEISLPSGRKMTKKTDGSGKIVLKDLPPSNTQINVKPKK